MKCRPNPVDERRGALSSSTLGRRNGFWEWGASTSVALRWPFSCRTERLPSSKRYVYEEISGLRIALCARRRSFKKHGKFVGRVFARPCRIVDGCWTSQLSLDRFARTERRNGTTMDDEGGRL
jgi:hypothetical protein